MSEFKSKMKSNVYNLQDLNDDIETHRQSIIDNEKNIGILEKSLSEKDTEIEVATNKKEKLLSQKTDIDEEIKNINPQTLKSEIETLIEGGVEKKDSLAEVTQEIEEIGEVSFNEDQWNELNDEKVELKLEIGSLNKDIETNEKSIKGMRDGEFCSLCKQPLKDVDHSEQIKEIEDKNKELIEERDKKSSNLLAIGEILTKLAEEKTKSDNKDKKSLIKDRLEIELDRLRVDVKEKRSILKEYEKNLNSIENNRDLDSKILGYNQLLTNLNLERDNIKNSITESMGSIENSGKVIEENESLIKTIKKENEVLRIFDIYHRMVGKNGISKLVLTSVIPIINYELDRLLDEVCDFDIQLEMNDKNEVEFLIVKSGVTKKLKSGSGLESTIASLALRCILGRVSTLPKPNVIVFDEVLGKVANVNLDYVKLFFDKIKTMFDTILFITHNPIAQEWADKMITVSKKDDISTLNVKKITEEKTLFDV
jgi:DNA repair exonuclease SbcCD ATPase subunit